MNEVSSQLLDDERFSTALEKAARRGRVQINTSEAATVLRADSTVAIAPVREFDMTPATELRTGVDVAFAYIDVPSPTVPAGYYTVRVTADVTEVGETRGTAELVDARGRVSHELAARVDVRSLTLPDPRPFAHTAINLENRVANEDLTPTARPSIIIIIVCPNGVIIVIILD